jgi:hypothetical protein
MPQKGETEMANEQQRTNQPQQGQQKAPEQPRPLRTPAERIDAAEAFLEANSWTRAGIHPVSHQSTWNDPLGSDDFPVKKETGRIPNKDEGTDRIVQTVGPPIPWVYQMDEAVNIQRQRDEAPAKEKRRKEQLAKLREEQARQRAAARTMQPAG